MADEQPFGAIKDSLKRAAGALRDADVPFLLGGGLAAWAWGGPGTGHDLDVMVKPHDAERALKALEEAGMEVEKPPEGWLYKAWDGDVLVDIIFRPVGREVDDEMFDRAEELEVNAVPMKVMALEDILVTKLLALDEHALDYERHVEFARALRERIDWDDVRARTNGSPYAKAFFTMIEELGIIGGN
ncbi:MAG: nucleotidyltransferase family protein [Actinomycetota bacterium]|nr:nucleotidyltransferase family protein [Actinomycetota bacterium]